MHGLRQPGPKPRKPTVTKRELKRPCARRRSARLVSVVVTDKKGQPTAGLKKESFTVMDESSLQPIVFFSAESPAPVEATPNQRVGLNLEEKQYEYLSTAGIVLARHLTVASQTTDVRVFARDTSSEALGSVTIPVQALFEGLQAVSGSPAKIESPK